LIILDIIFSFNSASTGPAAQPLGFGKVHKSV
jgi:hypothetical protein